MGGDGVLLQIAPGMLRSEAHVRVSRKVENEIMPCHRIGEAGQMERIPFDKPERRMPPSLLEES